jgi:hypothetical protein
MCYLLLLDRVKVRSRMQFIMFHRLIHSSTLPISRTSSSNMLNRLDPISLLIPPKLILDRFSSSKDLHQIVMIDFSRIRLLIWTKGCRSNCIRMATIPLTMIKLDNSSTTRVSPIQDHHQKELLDWRDRLPNLIEGTLRRKQIRWKISRDRDWSKCRIVHCQDLQI